MINEFMFNGSGNFLVIGTARFEGKVIVEVVSTQNGSCCPKCNNYSFRVHSYYYRKILDLPILGNETWIRLKARKFYCSSEQCGTKVFTERFKSSVSSKHRKTESVQDKVSRVALLMGGNGGEKICRLMNIPVSSSTLIRSIHKRHVPEVHALRVVGIDDWAYRKGLKYGTVLVDMEQRKIIDLLPDREAHTVEEWLKRHPGIEVVSRDRYVNYYAGVTNALPAAMQVADRWHLIKNLGDAVKKVLQRLQSSLKQKAKLLYQQQTSGNIINSPTVSGKTQLVLDRKQKLIEEVKRLFQEGKGIRAISRELQLHRVTVNKYLQMEVAVPKNAASRTNILLFEDYIKNAIATRPGVKVKALFQEIKDMGYTGQKSVGNANISKYMPGKERIMYPGELPMRYWRPAQISLLLYRKMGELKRREKDLVNYLANESSEVKTCYELFQRFRNMMETKQGDQLMLWVNEAIGSSVRELQSFGQGILNDVCAVQNAIDLPWSNGQVEGQINKLKMIKRQMFGRASFELLRKRLICNTG